MAFPARPRRFTALAALVSYLAALFPLPALADARPATRALAAWGTVTPEEGGVIRLKGARIEVPPGAVRQKTKISIRTLDDPAVLDGALANVTSGAPAYSFGPHGLKFEAPVRVVLPFDPGIADSPTALSNLFTYRYDDTELRWERLPRVSVDSSARSIVSETTHFSDMISATLRLPEGPESIEFDPNSIKSLGVADPLEGVAGVEAAEPGPFGAASFRIPLRLPPGRAGMTPVLALRYSSEGTGGLAGRGFEIEGSAVTTDSRFGCPRYEGADTWLLDGRELVRTRSEGNADVFRPRVERDFLLIRRYADENWWEVTDKGGIVREYGRGEGWEGPDRADRSRIYEWRLTEERDPFGNTIEYEYACEGGHAYLSGIRYTGNELLGEEGTFRVAFVYEDREDRRQDCRGGFVSTLGKRLSRVEIFYRGENVRAYRFEYGQNLFGQSLLARFSEADGQGNEFWAYAFDYYGLSERRDESGDLLGYQAFDAEEAWSLGGAEALQSTRSGSGGMSLYVGVELFAWVPFLGKRTLASFGVRGGFGSVATTSGAALADVNGDGRVDAVSRNGNGLSVRINTGTGFSAAQSFYDGIPAALDRERQTSAFLGASAGVLGASGALTRQHTWSEARTAFADVDGDGYLDFLSAESDAYARGTGASFEAAAWESYKMEAAPGDEEAGSEKEYGRTYYLQEPLRKWKACRSGTVEVTQKAELSDPGGASADGLVLRTYSGGKELSAIGLGPSTPGPVDGQSALVPMGRGQGIYFLADALDDERNDGADWNIEIQYRKAAVFEGFSEYAHLYDPPDKIPCRVFPYGDAVQRAYDYREDAEAWVLKPGWRDSADGETLVALAMEGWAVPAGMSLDDFFSLLGLCPDEDSIEQRIESSGETILVSERDMVLAGYVYLPEEGRVERRKNMPYGDKFAAKFLPALGEEAVRRILGCPLPWGAGFAWPLEETGGACAHAEKAPARHIEPEITETPGPGQVRPDSYLVLDTADDGQGGKETVFFSLGEDGGAVVSRVGADGSRSDVPAVVRTAAGKTTVSFRYRGVERRVVLSGLTSLVAALPGRLYAERVCPAALALPGESCTAANVESLDGGMRDVLASVSAEAASAFEACYEEADNGYVLRPDAPETEYERVLLALDELFDKKDSALDRLPGDPEGTWRVLLLSGEEAAELSRAGCVDLDGTLGSVRSADGTVLRYVPLTAGAGERETLESAMSALRCDESVFPHYERTDSRRSLKVGADARSVEAVMEAAGFAVWTVLEHAVVYRSTDLLDVADGRLPAGASVLEWVPAGTTEASAAEGREVGIVLVPAFDSAGQSVLKSLYIPAFDSGLDYSPENLVKAQEEFAAMDTPQEPFAGGVRGWYYGVWSGCYAFSESLLASEPQAVPDGEAALPPYFSAMEANRTEDGSPRIARWGGDGDEVPSDAWVGPVSELSSVQLADDGSLSRTTYAYAAVARGDHLVPARNGGDTYWSIPREADAAADTLAFLRKSRSSTLDVNGGLSLAGFGASLGRGEGASWQYCDLMDLNGDRYPDLVRFKDGKDGGESFDAAFGTGGGFGEARELRSVFPHLRYCVNESWVFGASLGSAAGSSERTVTARGNVTSVSPPDPKGEAFSAGTGVQGSFGSSSARAAFCDINGDGLPDQLSRSGGPYAAALNLGGSSFSSVRGWEGGISMALFSGGAASVTDGLSFQSSGSYGGSISGTYQVAGSGPSLNIGFSATVNRAHSGLYDVNGDGLPDEVVKDADEPFFRVRANLGDRFSDEEIRLWRPDWSEDPSAYLSGGLESDLAAVYASMDADVPGACLRPPETLPDESENRFSELFDPFRIEDVLEYETGVSYSFGASVSIFVPLALLAVTTVPGINLSVAKTSATLKFMDIDGDGLPDHVLRLPGQDRLLVRRNISGKAGLLKSASLPEGGSYRFEYESVGNTPRMPQRRWVMSALTRSAGSLPSDRGKTEYRQTYAYEGGYYDRAERMFFGFSRVTAARADGSVITGEYHNRDLWLRGMIRRSAVADSSGALLAEAITETEKTCVEGSGRNAVWFPAVAAEERRVYDPDGSSCSARRMEYAYDIDTGNVIRARDLGDPALAGDDLSASIRYASLDYRFRGHPESIEVADASGAVLRRRSASYGERGEPVALDEYYEEGRYARSALSWDEWGNLASVTDPRGSRVIWEYDDEVHAHAVAVVRDNVKTASDSYVTRAEWDYGLGRALSRTDANGRTMSLSYDACGRLLTVRSPYDDPGGTPALRFEYRMGAFPWTAVAWSKISHDPDDEQALRTVSAVDGLGRKLQTAKEGERRGASGERIHGWNVSGAVAYDGVGRTDAEGQPVFIEADGPPCLGGMERPTSYGYDGLDRTVLTVLPDGATIKVEYGIASGCPVATTIDPLGNRTEERSDARGNTLTVTRKDQSGTVLTSASYAYDALGQMLRATDARGSVVRSAYDLAGRRVSLESADTGDVRWGYDESGNLARKTDDVLRSRKEAVRYEYDGLNRLIRIDYPRSADTVFEYGASGAGNGAGRLVRSTDQSGTSSWAYGKLGEVTAMTRSIDRLTPLADPEQADFSYEWDYLGRLQRVVYPDGEIVAYGYDAGGRIRTVTGRYGSLATEYVKDIAYDARGRRSRIEYGNGTATSYAYDEDRQWLASIRTASSAKTLQDMEYSFDAVGNVLGYVNVADAYETSQSYAYDSLYQLVRAQGTTTSKPYGVPDRTVGYLQTFAYDEVGNLTRKTSRSSASPGGGPGDDLDYSLAYTYREGKAHQPEIIGNDYLAYDANGNLVEAREGGHGTGAAPGGELYRDGDVRYTDCGFGLVRKEQPAGEAWARYCVWDEENRLIKSVEGDLTVRYRYGADGQRAVKCSGGSETLYFDPLWQASTDYPGFRESKHVYVGRTRVATRLSLPDSGAAYAQINTYYYHPDHLGSAQLVTDYRGAEYERIEYTPHGELWAEKTSESLDKIPFRFTGKELDEETGLYYCGARYLDPKTGMWISADPALGEYVPRAPESVEARARNRNLPGMGGVYNPVNLHLYHYALNNPVRYTDPDGREVNEDPSKLSNSSVFCAASLINPIQALHERRMSERPDTPYSQRVLPDSPNGRNEACFFRVLLRFAEIAAGVNFSVRELNDLWEASLAAGEIEIDSLVNRPNDVLKRAFKKMELSMNPYLDHNPQGAKGVIVKLERMVRLETGVSTVRRYRLDTHFQAWNMDGTLLCDPWGRDISGSFKYRREVRFYVHY